MSPIFRGTGDPLTDSRIMVWFVKMDDGPDGESWGYETIKRGSYGWKTLDDAMKGFLEVQAALRTLDEGI